MTTTLDSQHDHPIRPYTHKELKIMYNVSWRTLQRWLKKFEKQIGPKSGHFYTAKQVAIIFKCIGRPDGEGG